MIRVKGILYHLSLFLVLVLFVSKNGVGGKKFQGNFSINKKEKIHYLTKFSCNIGTCEFIIKMKLKDNIFAILLDTYHKMNNKDSDSNIGNNNGNNTSDSEKKILHMNFDNAYYVLTNTVVIPKFQRITVMQDNEQKLIKPNNKCYSLSLLRNVHKFNIPFYFKYYDLINIKTYNLKHFLNPKYSLTLHSMFHELQNNKKLQSEILNKSAAINVFYDRYGYKQINAKIHNRVHVMFVMFDDCYDSFINNLKSNIKSKLAYWEYLKEASKNVDISNLSIMDKIDIDSITDHDDRFYTTYNFNKDSLLYNPKRLLFLENKYTESELADISFFIKFHNFNNMKNFTNMYNNLYKSGYYEKVIDYIYENDGFKIEYEVNILQTNNSHFSYELLYSPFFTFILTILYILLILKYGNKIIENVLSPNEKKKHTLVISVAVVMCTYLIANSLLLTHLLVYSRNGVGIPLLKISYDILNFLCQIIMCTMLLSLSYGLTIFEASFNIYSRIKIIFSVITFFHIVLVILDNIAIGDSSSKYFDNDNITGYIILGLRILLAMIYHNNLNNLFLKAKVPQIRSFLKNIYIYGLFYILSFPIIFFACYIFDTYWRQRFMLFGTAFLQFLSTYFITKMLLTNSEYFKVSDMSASDLPGATSSLFFANKVHEY
ncbi:integral membrane protein GPR180, putative [Hepatocystis sp. ex Piliocolobus tephrosceles]|nr:integral membrane protein GPR180, putative [Hepatocystis sp. ex Piliocolobus tephrosceles]